MTRPVPAIPSTMSSPERKPATLGTLSNEILAKIFRYAHDPEVEEYIEELVDERTSDGSRTRPRAIISLSLTCKHFRDVAESILFSAFVVRSHFADGPFIRTVTLFMEQLLAKPERLDYLNTVCGQGYFPTPDPDGEAFDTPPQFRPTDDFLGKYENIIFEAMASLVPDVEKQKEWLAWIRRGQIDPLLALILPLCPNIRRFVYSQFDCLTSVGIYRYYDVIDIVESIAKLGGMQNEPSKLGLQKLEKFTFRTVMESFIFMTGPMFHLPRLQSFHLLCAYEPFDNGTVGLINRLFPAEVQQEIKTLSIEYSRFHPKLLGPLLKRFKCIKNFSYTVKGTDPGNRHFFGNPPVYTYFATQPIRDAIDHLASTLESLTIANDFNEKEPVGREDPKAARSFTNFKNLKSLDVPSWFLNGKDWRSTLPTDGEADKQVPTPQRIMDAVPPSLETLKVSYCGGTHIVELVELVVRKKELVPHLKVLTLGMPKKGTYQVALACLEAACGLQGITLEAKHSGYLPRPQGRGGFGGSLL